MTLKLQTTADSDQVAQGTGESSLPAKPRGSRWRRYSLRALMLLQVVIAVFVGVVVVRVRSIQNQHEAA